MTNINIPLPEELHKQLKVQAVMKNMPLKDLITEHLTNYVRRRRT